MKNIPIEHITIDHMRVAQAIQGEGKAVLLLHGWGANISLVWPLAETLVATGFRCYALDLPGFGESEDPPHAWSVTDYVDFIIHYLDYHGLQEVFLFGHSFGGRLGLVLGAEHSQRIKKMALSDSAGIKQSQPLWIQFRLNAYKKIRDILFSIGLRPIAEELQRRYNKRYGSTDFQQVSGVMRETLVQVINQDLTNYAKQVQSSTLLFWGDQDQDTPLWMGKKLEQLIPDAGLIVHKGAGHYAYLDFLADTARIMTYFFQQEN